ncbi:MAG: TRIC cation channel family protein [Candidatus Pacebacteria bacterium]|nr:TRIC cation channel family protein [Candidatus Paceibacterota bacterium]
MLYFLDLLGTFAFAITGAYRGKMAKLHIFGVIFLGVITAVGGGTIRDLIIDRVPLFYIGDLNYILVCLIAGILIYIIPTFFKKAYSFFRLMDSIGLASFVIIGVSATFNQLFSWNPNLNILSLLACVFLGMLTGFGGGIIRDSIMGGGAPMSLRQGSNYALSAFLGSLSFYLLMFVNIQLAIVISFLTTLILREFFSKYGIYSKIIKK